MRFWDGGREFEGKFSSFSVVGVISVDG
jgi:hypothetical protein